MLTSQISTYSSFRITVGYDLYDTTPRCELRSDFDPIPLDEQFRMDCTVKRSNLTINMAWIRITPDGSITNLDSQPTGGGSEPINYLTRYVRPNEPYSDYIGSTVVCTVTSPDLPGVANNCSFGPFMGPTTTPPPTTTIQTTTPMPPMLTVSSNDRLEGIKISGTVSFNCTVTVPEGYMIGIQNFGPGLCCVAWRNEQTGDLMSLNETALIDPRLSAKYFNSTGSIEHIFELTITNVQPSDTGSYMCRASIFKPPSTPVFDYVLNDTLHISVEITTPMPSSSSTNMPSAQSTISSDMPTTEKVPTTMTTAMVSEKATTKQVLTTKPKGPMLTSKIANTGKPGMNTMLVEMLCWL